MRCACLRQTGDARSGRRPRLRVLLAALVLTSAMPARGAEPVPVRAGIHPGFGRLVLEWRAPVEVEGRQEDDRYRLRFGRPLEAGLGAAVGRLRDYVESARLSSDGRQLALDVVPGVVVRQTVHEGRIVVLDLAPAAPSALVEVRTGLHDGFGRIVFEWPVPTTFDAVATDRQVAIRFSRAGDIHVARAAARLAAWLAQASAGRSESRSEVRLDLQPGVTARVFEVDNTRVAVDLATAPARAGEGGAAVGTQTAAPARPSTVPSLAPVPDPAAPPPDDTEPANPTSASGVDDRNTVLEFAWTRPVAAAVFVRAGHLWVVFAGEADRPEDLAVPPALRDHLGQGERIEASGGTAIRFALRGPLPVETRCEDRMWRVRLSAAAQAPRPLSPLRVPAPARLRLAPGESPHLVVLRDPGTGDRVTIWPLLQPNLGQPRQSFVELELLATAQGLAWRLHSDRVRARIVGDAVEFDAPGGLALSEPSAPQPIAGDVAGELQRETTGRTPAAPARTPAAEAASAPTPTSPHGDAPPAAPARTPAADAEPAPTPLSPHGDRPPADAAAPLLGLVGWGLDPAYTAPERRSALLQALAQATPDDRDARRLELARYYLSRGLAAEALGALGAVEEPADEATRLARQALTGAAELVMGRLDAAAAPLHAAPFDDDPEVALWRSAVAASRQDWPEAARQLERSEQVLATYPDALRLRLGLAAARTAVETGDAGMAATLLAPLGGLELAAGERARLEFLSGVASARNGAIEAANEVWRALEHDGPIDVRIQAAYARTELLLEIGQLEPAEAVARLAATRGLWPGHPWEERMLGGLAQIHVDAGDRASALRTWRELLDRYPGTVDAPTVTQHMRKVLIEALRADGDAEFGPVQAYGLFREFEPLLPHDELGDDLRRGMARRVAELDLIRPAAALLDALVTDRLAGIDKAIAEADLAALWLREPAPEEALAALERSHMEAALPSALDQRRRILRADALARLERRSAALELLDGLHTPAADNLRVAILWQEQDWPGIVSAIEHALARRDPRSPLTEDEQVMVLKLALAHGRLGHSAALADLRTRFAAALRAHAIEPAFLMATSAPATAGDPEAVLAAAEQHLRRVRGYLEAEQGAN
jgi:hypothetical protein